jgi:hypothetical protein
MALTTKQVNQLSRIAEFLVLETHKPGLYTGIIEDIFNVGAVTAMRLLINGTENQKLQAINMFKEHLIVEQQKAVDVADIRKATADETYEEIDSGEWE